MDDNTRRTYSLHIHRHLSPHLGHIRLAGLRATHVEDMYQAVADRNERIRETVGPDATAATLRRHGHLAPATIASILRTLRVALNHAIRKHRLIDTNAVCLADLPAPRPVKALVWTEDRVQHWQQTGTVPSPVMVWTPAQAGRFLDYVKQRDPDLYPLFMLVLHRGSRRGEAIGLCTGHVGLHTGSVTVSSNSRPTGARRCTKPSRPPMVIGKRSSTGSWLRR
ncbi:hypothetical protein [Allorhizocola rhizosphaerae]|uniref:hypothetical protein n=1 Tax=Allorhizocola rhizosphaerae TaxID=1872709 RepID=UPI000E3E3C7E|nr:hypothetical protein [Allorhizocola rhizosphaerae]